MALLKFTSVAKGVKLIHRYLNDWLLRAKSPLPIYDLVHSTVSAIPMSSYT